eukprot:ctg_2263.g540
MGLNASKLKKQMQGGGKKKGKAATAERRGGGGGGGRVDATRKEYMFQMWRVSKTLPNGKELLKDINLAFFPGAKIRSAAAGGRHDRVPAAGAGAERRRDGAGECGGGGGGGEAGSAASGGAVAPDGRHVAVGGGAGARRQGDGSGAGRHRGCRRLQFGFHPGAGAGGVARPTRRCAGGHPVRAVSVQVLHRHRRGHHALALVPGEHLRVDPGDGRRTRHSAPGQLLVVVAGETGAAGAGQEGGRQPPPPHRGRVGVDPGDALGPASQEQGACGSLRGAVLATERPRGGQLAPAGHEPDRHAGRAAPGRRGHRGGAPVQGVRRAGAHPRCHLLHTARLGGGHHRRQWRRQVDALPHDYRAGAAGLGRAARRRDREADEICGGKENIGEVLTLGTRQVNARAYCSWFNFRGADQQKLVGQLSGGERNRLNLAKAILNREHGGAGNVLLLDEPGNDLDTATLANLEQAILDFPGVVLAISHDPWFLSRVATHILAFEGNSELRFYTGGFEEYQADKAARLGAQAVTPSRMKFRPLPKM